MKKGYVSAILFLLTFFVGLIGLASAEVCIIDGVNSPTGCVCGHSPNSSIGYGQIIIGGATPTIISCSNAQDGICPEDFMDPITGLTASCSRCPDPDCTGTVWGFVNDSTGRPIEKAMITGHPVKWNDSNVNLDKDTLTNSVGKYNYSGFVTGKYYFSASKDAYDTELLEAQVTRGGVTRLDFALSNGTCHEDCTNSYNRCNKACDGVTFNDTGNNCSFYNDITYIPDIKTLCNNKPKGTQVRITNDPRNNATHSYFIDCCEGEPYVNYYSQLRVHSNAIEDLVTNQQITTYESEPVTIVIRYW
jgi:hypothetical protein